MEESAAGVGMISHIFEILFFLGEGMSVCTSSMVKPRLGVGTLRLKRIGGVLNGELLTGSIFISAPCLVRSTYTSDVFYVI